MERAATVGPLQICILQFHFHVRWQHWSEGPQKFAWIMIFSFRIAIILYLISFFFFTQSQRPWFPSFKIFCSICSRPPHVHPSLLLWQKWPAKLAASVFSIAWTSSHPLMYFLTSAVDDIQTTWQLLQRNCHDYYHSTNQWAATKRLNIQEGILNIWTELSWAWGIMSHAAENILSIHHFSHRDQVPISTVGVCSVCLLLSVSLHPTAATGFINRHFTGNCPLMFSTSHLREGGRHLSKQHLLIKDPYIMIIHKH